jgi:hypothetical protein
MEVPVLQKLGDHIANCLARAEAAERRAAEFADEALRTDNEKMAQTWRHLARSYEFVESLERFLLDGEKARNARPPDHPIETTAPAVPPFGAVFEPATLALLSAAYDKAVEGQPEGVREIIAKSLVELASQGERDPDRLCHGALALSMSARRATG